MSEWPHRHPVTRDGKDIGEIRWRPESWGAVVQEISADGIEAEMRLPWKLLRQILDTNTDEKLKRLMDKAWKEIEKHQRDYKRYQWDEANERRFQEQREYMRKTARFPRDNFNVVNWGD